VIKYLGVHFESGLKTKKHIAKTTQKSVQQLRKGRKARWGLGQAAIRTPYKGLFEPIITYAATGWSDLQKGNTKTKLLRTQRMALQQVTRAYRTTSTEALQIIAGVMPIDLLIEVRARLYRKKRSHTEGSSVKAIIQEAIQTWHEHWQTTSKGRTTFEYFNNPKERIVSRWVNPDHYVTQFISGRGDFNSKLKTFQSNEVDTCDCGMEETPQHILEVCRLFDEERQRLRNSMQEMELSWPKEKWEFITKDVYSPPPPSVHQERSVGKRAKEESGTTRNEGPSPTRKTTSKKTNNQTNHQEEAQGKHNKHENREVANQPS
jgi:hypothetical protein